MMKIIPLRNFLRYAITMKPSIPENGVIISLDSGIATVVLKGGSPCKGCGAGKIGLCRPGGNSMKLVAKNTIDARIGDTVEVGIDRSVRRRGYLLAYVIPLVSFIAGALAGHVAGHYLGVPSADVPAGFLALASASFITFRKLRQLDRTSMMTIQRVVRDAVFERDLLSDEERSFELYLASR